MIIDTLKNAALYAGLGEKFAAGFAFLSRAVAEDLAPGKYEIDGDAIYASVQEYETFPVEGRVFEGHKRYIDLQFIAKGKERMEILDIARAKEIKPYDEGIEAALFTESETPTTAIFREGDFAIFFPHDLHRPGLRADGEACAVKKIVVKIEI
jgi:YhcH/YjgK/YiaL family protein